MPRGHGAEELPIEHEGKRGERKPIAHLGVSEGPDDALVAQALLDFGAVGDVLVVVEIEELETGRLGVDQADRQEQEGRRRRAPASGSQGVQTGSRAPPARMRVSPELRRGNRPRRETAMSQIGHR